jgi:transcription termination factor Rho
MDLPKFVDLEAEIPYQRLRLETVQDMIGPRLIDLLVPLGKGQRGLIVAPPQAGKTRILKDIATSVMTNHPSTELFILLIDERPEEVTELRSLRLGKVIASSFDESRVGHLAAAELAMDRIQRLVEAGKDVFVLMDSLTRLARASNLSIRGTGRSLSGGLDPAALQFPRKLFGSARATQNAGNLTILATALVETGSVMDEFVFQEFKGTGNWEIKLDRRLAQRRIFPAVDIGASSTRREEMLYTPQELNAVTRLRQYLYKFSQQSETRSERLVWLLTKTRSNAELLALVDRL